MGEKKPQKKDQEIIMEYDFNEVEKKEEKPCPKVEIAETVPKSQCPFALCCRSRLPSGILSLSSLWRAVFIASYARQCVDALK